MAEASPSPTDLSLGTGYPETDDAAWVAMAEKLLKGKPIESLRHQTADGFAIEPLYTATDAPDAGWPGFAPFIRGGQVAGAVQNGWDVRQRYALVDAAAQNNAVLEGLERGVTSVWVRVDDPETLPRMLEGVLHDLAVVALDAGHQQNAAAQKLLDLFSVGGATPDQALGSLRLDPLGLLASTGVLETSLDDALAQLVDIATASSQGYPNVRSVAVDVTPYASAGASPGSELALSLATAVAYLRALTDGGLTIDHACAEIEFTYSADADQFATIAKLRAARRLWARVAEASGAAPASQAQRQHAVAESSMYAARDPWVNLLRGTVAAFAAGVGGADSVTVEPFDIAIGEADDLALRMARNTQLLLIEESNVGRVVDPAGGSWFVETLTEQLAEAAWTQFQAIEAGGGMAAQLLDGSIAVHIAETRDAHAAKISTRRIPLTGVSEFPHLDEIPLERPAVPARPRPSSRGTEIEPLEPYRPSAAYEAMRAAGDASPDLARVFLANLGPLATHTARASWTTNFLAAGGLRAIDDGGFESAVEVAAGLTASGCTVAVLCSSDARYAELAGDTAKALKDAGATMVLLAGNPGEQRMAYVNDGIDGFVHVGSDVATILASIHRELGTTGDTQ